MEPISGASELRDKAGQPVEAADVSEFVKKHDAAAGVAPILRLRGENDHGTQEAVAERDFGFGAAAKIDAPA